MPSELLTAKQFCELAGISEITASHWRHEGKGPKWIRLPNGRSIRYPRSDYDAWIATAGGPGAGKKG